jgi:hypothetical protein
MVVSQNKMVISNPPEYSGAGENSTDAIHRVSTQHRQLTLLFIYFIFFQISVSNHR